MLIVFSLMMVIRSCWLEIYFLQQVQQPAPLPLAGVVIVLQDNKRTILTLPCIPFSRRSSACACTATAQLPQTYTA
jgi:hypothetical protein